jgi:hypothetical protein
VGNDLDAAIRDGQDNQTAGIPVSSDVSHVVSEIIASVIDATAFSRAPSGYRYVDDYFLAFDSEADAVNAMERLSSAARNYEIDLNYSKTSIRHVKDLLEEIGLDELRDFSFADNTKVSTKEIHKLFDIAVRLNQSQENSLKYAIRVISRRDFTSVEWDVLESYFLRSVTLSPNTIDYVAIALYEAAQRGFPIDKARVSRFFCSVIKEATVLDRDSELVWSLWLLKNLGISVPRSITNLLGNMNSSTAALVALDMRARGLLRGTLDTSQWNARLAADELYDSSWLLVYEALIKGWLTSPTDIIGADASFNEMRQAGVHFYDENALQLAAPATPAPHEQPAPPVRPETVPRPGDAGQAAAHDGEAEVVRSEDRLVPAWILNSFARRTEQLQAEIGDDEPDADEDGVEEDADDEELYEWY